MGAFYVVNEPDRHQASRLCAALERSFGEQGFAVPTRLRVGELHLGLYPKRCDGRPQLHLGDATRFAAVTGTAVVDGHRGADAARVLGERFDPDHPSWDRCLGQFCGLLARGGELLLFLDPMGVYKVYRRGDGRVFCSSFLALAATLDAPRINQQALYEYLFQEATYGDETVLEDVGLARSAGCYVLGPGGERFQAWPAGGTAQPDRERRFDDHVRECVERLEFMFDDLVQAFGERIDTALSGGYDSRLMVALLRGRAPGAHIHVYGSDDAADVRIAKAIAQAEGFELEHRDKSAFPELTAEGFADAVHANYLAFDGYPPAGIFEPGADLATRIERSRAGHLMLNGGGGEVMRNFFYLPQCRYTPRQIVHAFYNRYDPASCSRRFDEGDYIHRLAQKIARCLDVPGAAPDRALARASVEWIYPAFRCRYWMGRNNAINNRLGHAMTPFVDPDLVARTLRVPLAWKNHGRLEAAIINAISPALARHRSDYGHGFDRPPPLKRIVRDWATLLRPTLLRRYTFRLRNRTPHPRGRWLQPRYLGGVIDPQLPCLQAFVQPQRCHDPGTFQRACTLEYLFTRLGARTG